MGNVIKNIKLEQLSLFATIIIFILSTANAKVHDGNDNTIDLLKGADVSFIPQIEDLGGAYKENGIPQDPLKIFKDHGMNCIRLKLWHTPAEPYNNLAKILVMAKRIKERELKFILDFHYSDTWADPGKQTKPVAWQSLSFSALKDSVYEYTKKVIRALYDQNTLPEIVQLGNEITAGMLWNDGRVGGTFNTQQQWQNLGELIKAGIRGIRESCNAGNSVLIMIHLDRGGDNGGCKWFFDNLLLQNVEFDIIGLSYYPWWHGTLDQVKTNLNDLAVRYGKDLMIAETAYPWTLQWFDNVNNIVSQTDQLHAGYPATVTGQAAFLRDLMKIIRNVKNQKGQGLCYWAPEYISVQPLGSPWENNALFDFYGNVLSSMAVFSEEPAVLTPMNVTIKLNTSTLLDALQTYHFTQIRGEVSGVSNDTLPDGKKVTWDTDSQLILKNVGGDYWEITMTMFPGDTLSYKFWSGFSRTQGTFQRLGWEGPITPVGNVYGNRRVLVAGPNDTVLPVQYFNSTGEAKQQYWQPFASREDSLAVYFRVNLGKAMTSGRFNPAVNGPVTVRGDAVVSGGSLDWLNSKVTLQREESSVNNGSFWSGVCYIPKSVMQSRNSLEYKFYIDNDSQNGWENSIANRRLTFTQTLTESSSDTTLHWVYFDESDSETLVSDDEPRVPDVFLLSQNYPNPFNQQTNVSYFIPKATWVSLKIYDIQSKLVASLVQCRQPAGHYSITWNAQDQNGIPLASGIYLVRLVTAQGAVTRKTLLLK